MVKNKMMMMIIINKLIDLNLRGSYSLSLDVKNHKFVFGKCKREPVGHVINGVSYSKLTLSTRHLIKKVLERELKSEGEVQKLVSLYVIVHLIGILLLQLSLVFLWFILFICFN